MTRNDEFVWLELKPQQNFQDDDCKKILDIIKRAEEFGFFVLRQKDNMRILVRASKRDRNLFSRIEGMSVEETKPPSFEKMLTKYLVLRRRTLEPLADLKAAAQGNVYSALWANNQSSMMACLVRNCTRTFESRLRNMTKTFQRRSNRSDVKISQDEIDENEAAKKRRGHAHYNCCIIFGVQLGSDLAELKSERKSDLIEENRAFKVKVSDLEGLDGDALKKERDMFKESHREKIDGISDLYDEKIEDARDEFISARTALDTMISNILPNQFEEKVFAKRAKFDAGKKRLMQKFLEYFGAVTTIDPAVHIPKNLYSGSIVLAENELACLVSFPTEHDIRTINFETGPNPTFMHGKTEDIEDTDLDIQESHEESSDDKDGDN